MNKDVCIKETILIYYGKYILLKDLASLVRLKKETLYKKIRELPEDTHFKQKGFIIIDVEKFLDYYIKL